jgi:hypothetical protein
LHCVTLHRDGPIAEIEFEPAEFPSKPSPKWPAGSNACQIIIRAIGLSKIDFSRWGTGVVGNIEIKAVQGGLEISFAGEGEFRFISSHIDVFKVSAYISGRT